MVRKPSSKETVRKAAERQMERARDVLAECARVLVRATEERQLLRDMCRIAVDKGGYLMAWVGLTRDDAQRSIQPVASEGLDAGYVESMRFSWGDDPIGRGPAGEAVRAGRTHAIRDARTDPSFAPWREAALARGYRAVAALPLKIDGATFGVLAIYSGEPGAFDAGEVHLLEELADDIAYGVGNLRRREAQQRAEAALALGYAVSVSIAQAESEAAAVRAAIRAICEKENWESGRYWRVDGAGGVLRLGEAWHQVHSPFDAFFAQWRAVTYRPGEGMAGKAWQTGEAQWAADIGQDPRVSQRLLAMSSGMRSVFAFPLVSEGETLGVLVFSSREVRERQENLVLAVQTIGGQIAQFLRRKRAEEELQRFRLAMDSSADMIVLIDRASLRFVDVNRTVCELLGYSREELLAMGPADLLPVSREELARDYDALVADPAAAASLFNSHYRRKDGSLLPFESRRRVLRSGDKVIIAAIARDIRERIAAESALRQSEHRMREQAEQQRLVAELGQQALASADIPRVLQRAADLVWTTLKVDYCNVLEREPGGRRMVYRAAAGWPAEWVDRRTIELRPGGELDYTLSHGEPLVVEDQASDTRFRAHGAILEFGIRASVRVPILGTQGAFGVLAAHAREPRRFSADEINFLRNVANILAVAIERKKAEEHLAYLAQFDSLTGLPNRYLFHDRLSQTMAHARRGGHSMAVLFIDLDRFKLVNDTLGHAGGDRLLKEAASRLRLCLRGGDTVARFGGDEFGAVLAELGAGGDAGLVAQKIIETLERPFDLDGNDTYVTASVGIAVFPADGEEAGTLIRNADTAMYRAKELGRNTYQYFTREMNERAVRRGQLEAAMRRAIERREFRVHYQPKVDLESGAIRGLEALLRWQPADLALVLPGEFVPVLEDTGLIVPVGEWVMREVCRQIRAWKGLRLAVPPVAVNLSARQFQQKDLESKVREILQEGGVDPSLVQLELTESLLMRDPESAARTMHGLQRCGVKIAVDDFGTGYSSLAYLKRFPIDTLKIDRAFVRDVTADPEDAAIVLSIIGLARGLRLKVVAEGVESEDQMQFLRSHGCDEMQGYYAARPAPGDELVALLRAGRVEL
jgi:diguanylate cyclase (GGDEF)-like protein/PAS domain S-box-containing protein